MGIIIERSGLSLSLPVERALRKFGSDIRDARRRIPTSVMAEGASIIRDLAYFRHDKTDLELRKSAYPAHPTALVSTTPNGQRLAEGPRDLCLYGFYVRPRIGGTVMVASTRGAKAPLSNMTVAGLPAPIASRLNRRSFWRLAPYHTGSDVPMFGKIGDSAPDHWGRVLMRRAKRRKAAIEGQAPRNLKSISYYRLTMRFEPARCASPKRKAALPCGTGPVLYPPLV